MSNRQLQRYLAYSVLGRIVHTRRAPRKPNGKGPARNWRYRTWIRSLPCLVCACEPSEAAHTGSDGGTKLKASDYSVRQLWEEHEANHEAFLRYLAAESLGLTSQGEVSKWRGRFWCAVAAGVALGAILAKWR